MVRFFTYYFPWKFKHVGTVLTTIMNTSFLYPSLKVHNKSQSWTLLYANLQVWKVETLVLALAGIRGVLLFLKLISPLTARLFQVVVRSASGCEDWKVDRVYL